MRLALLKQWLKVADEETGETHIEKKFEEMRLEYLPRMEYLDPEYDDKIEEEAPRVHLYLGDDFGILKLWDLSYMFQ